MKLLIPVLLMLCIVTFSYCNKSADNGPVNIINCQGLVTDTTGTGDNGRIYMPNAFTPNNDGLNDISRPITQNIASIVFTIYDQNDMVVFSSTVLGQGWQPTAPVNSATKYFYKIQATTNAGKKIGKCGDLYSLTCFPPNPPKSFYYFEDMFTMNGFTGTTNETLANCP